MKLLHLGDLHLGKKLNDVSLIEDQEYVLNEIIDIVKEDNIDGVMIAGDIYDKTVPTNEAFSLFSSFITNLNKLGKKVYAISGNHDRDIKISYFSDLLEKNDIYVSKKFKGTTQVINEKDEYGILHIHMLPFIKPSDVRRYYEGIEINSYDEAYKVVIDNSNINYSERNILICHQFFTGGIVSESEEVMVGGIDNISSDIVKDFDYVALGHLHMPQMVNKYNYVRYSGSILKYSFGEANHIKKAIIIDIKEKGNLEIKEIPLKFKRDVREIKGKYLDILNSTPSFDYLKITLTDELIPVDAYNSLLQIFPNIIKLLRNYSNTDESITNEEVDFRNESIIDIFKKFYLLQNEKEASEEVLKVIEDKLKEVREEE